MEEAYDQGYQAYYDGMDQEASPYDPADDKFDAWDSGWNDACEEDMEND